MQSDESCRYCDETVPTEAGLIRHISDEHTVDELGRIDQRRVTHHSHQPSSRIRQAVGDRPISRRATIAAAIGITGLGGFTLSVLGSSHTEINSWEDLHNIRDYLGDSYTLTTDLDADSSGYDDYAGPSANGGDGWAPINNFSGELDGNGHEVADLFIDRTGILGMFSDEMSGTIKNLGLIDVDITSDGTSGGLVGRFTGGLVESCYVTGEVSGDNFTGGVIGLIPTGGATIDSSFAAVEVNGGNRVGGLGGNIMNGTIRNCFALGDVDGNDTIGGLMGFNGGTIEQSYAAGKVTGSSTVGGLIGDNHGGTVTNSYWDVPASGQDDSDGGTGLGSIGDTPPADEMTGEDAETNMGGFDFDADWHLIIGGQRINPTPGEDAYPILQAIDTETQLEAQGISWSTGGSIGSLTIHNSTFENNSVGISIGDDE